MLSLIVLMIFGLVIAFFAGQNTIPVTISLANYQLQAVPLYIVIVGALLIGFFISWLVSLVEMIFNTFKLRGKDSQIRTSQRTVDQLQTRVHDLEVENARLRESNTEEHVTEKVADTHEHDTSHEYHPSFFERLKHSFR